MHFKLKKKFLRRMGIKNWVHSNLKTIIITSFLIPILLVAFVSIAHVTTWYGLSNPMSWAIYLSVAIEIAALGALAGISVNMGRFVYVPFGIVTFIQLLGNVFFAYTYIDQAGKMFLDWVEMVGPVFEPMGIESTDLLSHKRILSFLSGGFLPLISLTFAHMLVRFSEDTFTSNREVQKTEDKEIDIEVKEITPEDIENLSIEAGKMEATLVETPYKPTQEEIDRLQSELDKLLSKKKEDLVEDQILEEIQESEMSEGVNEESETRQINRLSYSPRNASNTEN